MSRSRSRRRPVQPLRSVRWRRPFVESLEDRRMLASDYSVVAGTPLLAEGNSLSTALTYTVTRTNPAAAGSLDYAFGGTATSGTDFNNIRVNGAAASASGTIAFTIGQTLATVTVDVLGDTTVETDETISVALSNPDAGAGTISGTNPATATVANDDFNFSLDVSNNLVFADVDGGGRADNLKISFDTGTSSFVFADVTNVIAVSAAVVPGAVTVDSHTVRIPAASIAGPSVIVNTGAGSDLVTVDLAAGNLPKPIVYDGGTSAGDDDRLTLQGGGAFASVAHTFTSNDSGSIDIAGNALISYSHLEPITDNLSAVARTFTFTSGNNEDITVADAAGAGVMSIDSTQGEIVTFAIPTASLTIDVGTNPAIGGQDTITFASVDSAYRASTTITAGLDDSVNLNAALTLGSATSTGDLAVTVGTVLVTQPIDTSGATSGAVSFLNITNQVFVTIGTDIKTKGQFTQTGPGSFSLNGNLTTTNSDVSFAGPFDSAGIVTIDAGNANITFSKTVSGVANDLTLKTNGGTITFGDKVGLPPVTLNTINSLTTSAGSTVKLNGSLISTVSDIQFGGNVTIGSASAQLVSIAGNISIASALTDTVTSDVTIEAGHDVSLATATLDGALAANPADDSALTILVDAFTDDGPRALTTTGNVAAGSLDIHGGTPPDETFAFGGDLRATGTGKDLSLRNAASMQFSGNVSADGNVIMLLNIGVVTANQTVTAGSDVAITAASVTFDNVVTAGLFLTLSAPTVKSNAGANLKANTLDVIISGGVLNLAKDVSVTAGRDVLISSELQLTGAGGTNTLTAGRDVSLQAVTLGTANLTVQSAGGGKLDFNGAIDGAANLVANTAGVTTFAGVIGGVGTPLATVTTNAGGATRILANITTAGNQSYNDDVKVGNAAVNPVVLTGNSFTLPATASINGALAGESLKIVATGTIAFNGPVGNTQALDRLTLQAGGAVTQTQPIEGSGLELLGAGPITLTNLGNDFATLAAAITGDINYIDGTALTVGTVNGTTGASAASISMGAGGQFTMAANVTSTATVKLTARESAVAVDQDNLIVSAGITIKSTAGDVLLEAGDDFDLSAATASVIAFGAINLASVDGGDTAPGGSLHPSGSIFNIRGTLQAGTQVTLTGLAQDDDFAVRLAGVTSPLPIQIQGGSGAESRTALVRDGRDLSVDATKRPFFIPAVASESIGDQLSLDDSGFGAPDARYVLDPLGVTRVGDPQPFATYQALELVSLKTRNGNNDVTAQMAISENQHVTVTGAAGTFTLTFNGQTTGNLAFNASAAAMQAALNGLATIGGVGGSVTVTKLGADFVVVFGGALDGQNVSSLVATGSGGVTANVSTVQNGARLPNIVQLDATDAFASPDNRFQVEGSGAADNISIGDIDTALEITGGKLRAHFELDGVQRLWARGNGGSDIIDNISKVPGVLDGGTGNDTINSIVNTLNSKLVLNSKNIPNSTIQNVTLVLGNAGADQLFIGAGAIDGAAPVGSVAAALKSFPDKGITFLVGDYKPGSQQPDGRFISLDVINPGNPPGEPGDTYSSSSNAFQHGFVALRDSAPARGIFRFGAGDKIKFSSTIAWLKAQIFIGVAKDNLVKLLAKQLAEFTKPVAASGQAEGESAAPATLADTSSPTPSVILSATTDVNRDGEISPIDALLIINELNAHGSRQVSLAAGGEGEDDLSSLADWQPLLDVDGDNFLAPIDALLVIDAINAFSTSPVEGSTESNAVTPPLCPLPTDLTATSTSTTTAISASAHDALFALLASTAADAERRRLQQATANALI
jgi:hypothetical protein